MLTLSKSIKVYIPETNNDGKMVDLTDDLKPVLEYAGGATTYKTVGNWVNDNKVYSDTMKVTQFNCPAIDSTMADLVGGLIKAIFEKAEQIAVSVEINNTLYILENTFDIDKLFSKYYNVVKEG